MANQPAWPLDTVEQLRLYKIKQSISDATLVIALNAYGWTWQESHIAALFAGRVKATNEEKQFFVSFLLSKFITYNQS